LLSRMSDTQPDVVLLEADSRDEDLHRTLQALNSRASQGAIVLLVDDVSARYLRDGARAVLPHGASAREILAAIEAVAAGLVVGYPDVLEGLSPGPALSATSDGLLTTREIEVLRMLSEGLPNKEIAWRLGISEHTVKFHVGSLFAKLNASSRTEAVTLGVRQGLILL
ncbi:MAG: response regulator transcription factor, partial [Acidobacteriota bacterium]|nr:response regulator transcription factor [Acidobacteriota bacterium]